MTKTKPIKDDEYRILQDKIKLLREKLKTAMEFKSTK